MRFSIRSRRSRDINLDGVRARAEVWKKQPRQKVCIVTGRNRKMGRSLSGENCSLFIMAAFIIDVKISRGARSVVRARTLRQVWPNFAFSIAFFAFIKMIVYKETAPLSQLCQQLVPPLELLCQLTHPANTSFYALSIPNVIGSCSTCFFVDFQLFRHQFFFNFYLHFCMNNK